MLTVRVWNLIRESIIFLNALSFVCCANVWFAKPVYFHACLPVWILAVETYLFSKISDFPDSQQPGSSSRLNLIDLFDKPNFGYDVNQIDIEMVEMMTRSLATELVVIGDPTW